MSISNKRTENSKTPPGQLDKFLDLSREFEAGEHPARFHENMKKIATKAPPEDQGSRG